MPCLVSQAISKIGRANQVFMHVPGQLNTSLQAHTWNFLFKLDRHLHSLLCLSHLENWAHKALIYKC